MVLSSHRLVAGRQAGMGNVYPDWNVSEKNWGVWELCVGNSSDSVFPLLQTVHQEGRDRKGLRVCSGSYHRVHLLEASICRGLASIDLL